VLVTAWLGCSKGQAPPDRTPPLTAAANVQHDAALPAPRADAPFAVGDKVVLTPTGIMVISAIGPRSKLTPSDVENVDFQPGNALEGKDTMEVVPADDELVYGLRFPGDQRDTFLLNVKDAVHEGLRHVSTPAEVDEFLRVLAETARASHQPGATAPKDVSVLAIRAGNHLIDLARFYPYLGSRDRLESDVKANLTTFFPEEIAAARGISLEAARAEFEAALK
jgi:RNA polymerase-interacting CarD/CdnL/TRCF family regulator